MSFKQVEKLYRKIIDNQQEGAEKLDPFVRSEIFQKIMLDVDRLFVKLKKCEIDSDKYQVIDTEIRNLLLKEIQVIIDDYVIAKKKGTIHTWQQMYGDIDHYIHNFHVYRHGCFSENKESILNKYGFYDSEN